MSNSTTMIDIFLAFLSAFTHLSRFYVFSILIAILAVTVTIVFKFRTSKKSTRELEGKDEGPKHGIQARYKHVRQRLIEKSLTPEQLYNERNVEVQTLTAIMEILQKRSDIFSAATMDDLEEQLNLYRRSYDI